jgi:DNA processing protein
MAWLAAWQDRGFRLIVPGDAEWPTQLDGLGDARPLVLWRHGSADLRLSCVNSVAIVGARARQPATTTSLLMVISQIHGLNCVDLGGLAALEANQSQ